MNTFFDPLPMLNANNKGGSKWRELCAINVIFAGVSTINHRARMIPLSLHLTPVLVFILLTCSHVIFFKVWQSFFSLPLENTSSLYIDLYIHTSSLL